MSIAFCIFDKIFFLDTLEEIYFFLIQLFMSRAAKYRNMEKQKTATK